MIVTITLEIKKVNHKTLRLGPYIFNCTIDCTDGKIEARPCPFAPEAPEITAS